MKLCVLILSTQESSFQSFKQAIRETWAAELIDSKIDYFFYEGNYKSTLLDGDTIKLNCKDDLGNVYDKLVEALKLLKSKKYDYDCIFRTNLSSYIDVEVFKKYINHFNINSRSYIGIHGEARVITEFLYSFKYLRWLSRYIWAGKIINYKSGAGFFIGNKLVNILLETRKSNIFFLDDVMIGYLLEQTEYEECPIFRFDIRIDNSHKIDKKLFEKLVNDNHLFHYRLKNENRNFDIKMMYSLKNKDQRIEICSY